MKIVTVKSMKEIKELLKEELLDVTKTYMIAGITLNKDNNIKNIQLAEINTSSNRTIRVTMNELCTEASKQWEKRMTKK